MKPIILIPEDIITSNISSDAKLLYGIMMTYKAMDISIDIYSLPYIKDVESCLAEINKMKGVITVPDKKEKLVKTKEEDWNNLEIGVWVGPNSRKIFRLYGAYLHSFNLLYIKYGNKNGKRSAAWAFYQTIKPMLDESASAEDKKAVVNKILKSATKAHAENLERELSGHTPQFLQGWITGRRWEDYE